LSSALAYPRKFQNLWTPHTGLSRGADASRLREGRADAAACAATDGRRVIAFQEVGGLHHRYDRRAAWPGWATLDSAVSSVYVFAQCPHGCASRVDQRRSCSWWHRWRGIGDVPWSFTARWMAFWRTTGIR